MSEISRWIDVEQARVPVWSRGSGPHIVFVHGWPLHSATWREHVERLAADYTCHVFDLPGSGRSEFSRASDISIAGHCATVRAVLDALDLPRYALIAHDSGGVFARVAAAGDPRCAGLVMGNTEIPGHHPALLRTLLTIGRLPGGPALLGLGMTQRWIRRTPLVFGGCFDDVDHADGEFHDLFVAPLLKSRKAFAGQMALLDGFDWDPLDALPAVHARISAPTLLVWGSSDPWFPLDRARGMLDQFGGGATIRELSGKLFVHEEHPGTFVDASRPFLDSCFT